jgi:hypothetical protein
LRCALILRRHGASRRETARKLRGTGRFVSEAQTTFGPRLTAASAAFVDFLQNYKSTATEAADQLENLNLNGDGDSDEYDMVNDEDDPAPGASQRRNRQNKAKYVQMLQDIADRTRTNILIDLNDLDMVRSRVRSIPVRRLMRNSGKRPMPATSSTD